MDLRKEQDLERLRQVALLQEREIKHLLARIQELVTKLSELQGDDARQQLQLELDRLQRQIAQATPGNKSERSGKRRPRDGQDPDHPKPQTGHGPTPQPELEVVVETYTLEEQDRVCPECKMPLKEFGDNADESELIDVIERRFIVRKVRLQKYVCSCASCDHRETAEGPEDRLMRGGRYSVGFTVLVAVLKYLDHNPLVRLERSFARQGLTVTSQTLFDQLYHMSVLLMPTYAALRVHILNQPTAGLDQTGWPVHIKGKASKKTWQMWGLTCENAIYHSIAIDKSEKSARALLGQFAGVIVGDDASTHHAAARGSPWRLQQCMTHIRRYFVKAATDFEQADEFVELFDELFEIERRGARVEGESREQWLARVRTLRDVESRAVMNRLEEKIVNYRGRVGTRTTSLGHAVFHARKVWRQAKLFLDDAEVWLSNNLTERSFRGPAVGRRNHYGSRSERGTQVAAVMYSLLESAKLCGLEPGEYLAGAVREVLDDGGVDAKHVAALPHEVAART